MTYTKAVAAALARVDAINRGCLIGTYEDEAKVLAAALRLSMGREERMRKVLEKERHDEHHSMCRGKIHSGPCERLTAALSEVAEGAENENGGNR